ncbi:MAG: periplasmic heavy metal sensor [Cyclobacteriaceae bacterium]
MKRSFTLVVLLVIIGTSSFAQSNQQQRMQYRQKMMQARADKPDRGERFAEALELSDEQKTKIEAIKLESMKSMKSVKNQIGEKNARLKTLSTADNPDSKAITKVAQEIGDLKTQIFVSQVHSRQSIRALLDEKQKMKFDMMTERKGRKMMHRRMGAQRGHGQMKRG